MLKDNIFITGFMGTGKSTVACALAKKINKNLIDTDKIIESRIGKSIAEIFDSEGEEYFRRIEKQIFQEIASINNLVIATGGGTLLDKENHRLALKNGIIILLQASPQVIFSRLQKENLRPLLSGKNKLAKIIDLLNKRKAKYCRFEYCIDTSYLTVNQVVEKIIQIYWRKNNENNITEI
ncbi:MAG: shikimate kinase [Atribacterota bacterium]|nr:shikimate kinase [Atribacterota bacterium]MDD4765596.1 shikimate kinase [Atribacterota bacterium]